LGRPADFEVLIFATAELEKAGLAPAFLLSAAQIESGISWLYAAILPRMWLFGDCLAEPIRLFGTGSSD
jgi:hypothetical protein